MSDESKFFKKCKCNHCSLPVSFPSEMLGKTIECPHCKCQTLLLETKETEKVVEKPLAPPPPPAPAVVPTPPGIVHNLEYVGEVFLSLGFFGMVAAAIAAAVMHYKSMDANQTLWMVIVAIVSFLPGLFIKNLFFALAEIIRLLRAIDARGNAAASSKSSDTIILKLDETNQVAIPASAK